MKIRSVVALIGLTISFAVPTFAQQTNTPDPQLREALVAYDKKYDEAFNNNDAAAVAALYTEDAVQVAPEGLIYGRKAIEKHYADLFQKVHFSNHLITPDQYSPHSIGTAGNEMWATGEWSCTITVQGQNAGPIQLKGYESAIKVLEDTAWKTRMDIFNITPPPAVASSPATTPSSK